jgi:hypothetical protein
MAAFDDWRKISKSHSHLGQEVRHQRRRVRQAVFMGGNEPWRAGKVKGWLGPSGHSSVIDTAT